MKGEHGHSLPSLLLLSNIDTFGNALACSMGNPNRSFVTRVSEKAHAYLTRKPEPGEAILPAAGVQIDAWLEAFLLSQGQGGASSAADEATLAGSAAMSSTVVGGADTTPATLRQKAPPHNEAASSRTPPSQKVNSEGYANGRPSARLTSASKCVRYDGLPDRACRATTRQGPYVMCGTLELQRAFGHVRCVCGRPVLAMVQVEGHSCRLTLRCAAARVVAGTADCQFNVRVHLAGERRVHPLANHSVAEKEHRMTRPLDDAFVFARIVSFVDQGRCDLMMSCLGLPGAGERVTRRLAAIIWQTGEELFKEHLAAVRKLYILVMEELHDARMVIATDATFDSARAAMYAICPVIDVELHLCLGVEIVSKKEQSTSSDHLEYIGSLKALTQLLAYLRDMNKAVYGIVHDEVRSLALALAPALAVARGL